MKSLAGYAKSADGLYRRRVHFVDRKNPQVLVRRPDGTLLRVEKLNPKPERKRI